jgi:hypothetical protein
MDDPKYIRIALRRHVRNYGPKILRLSVFATVVCIGLLFAVGYNARAQVSEQMMSLGVDMLRYEGAEYQRAPRTMFLNGQAMKLSTGLAPHDLTHVLDYYESRCRDRGGRFSDQLAELVEGDPEVVEAESKILDPTLRQETEDEGFVACIDTLSDEELDPESVAAAFERFQNSLDLAEFGEMRYIYAQRAAEGGTFFVAFWIEGSFKVAEMFPATGDAPGRDVAGVPRPPNSRRLLSSWEEGQSQSVTTYVGGTHSPDELEEFYRAEMETGGWEILEVDPRYLDRVGAAPPPENFLTFEQGDRMVSIALLNSDAGPTASILTHR